MFKNYLVTALYFFRKQPAFSFIKIASLTLGLSCALLVLMHVQYINGYDRHFPNWENIYRIVSSTRSDYNMSAEPFAAALAQDYAQIEHIAKLRPNTGLFHPADTLPTEASYNSYFWVEPSIVDLFSLEFVYGDRESALLEANSIVLNETTARKYFGDINPVGQVLRMNNQTDVQVTGVMRDLPANTYLDIQAMVPVETGRQINGENFMGGNGWINFGGTQTFFSVSSQAEAESIANDLDGFLERNLPENNRPYAEEVNFTLSLEPLSSVYMSPRIGYNSGGTTRARIFYGLVLFASLILLTSCINFGNLSLTQVQQRSREIGVRKAVGANRTQVVVQFLFEAMLLTLLALLLALPLIYLALPVYTNLTATAFVFSDMFNSGTLLWLLLVVLGTGVFSGIFPALSLSRFEPATMVRSNNLPGRTSGLFRSLLTVFQFSLSTTLVILAVAITLLVEHLNDMPVGFDRENLVVVNRQLTPVDFSGDWEELNAASTALIDEFLQHPGILSVSQTQIPPPNTGPFNPWARDYWPDNRTEAISHIGVDENYVQTMALELLAGRGFSRDFPADFMSNLAPDDERVYGIIVTRDALDQFELGSPQDAVDEILDFAGYQFRIVGVVENFRLSGGVEDVSRSVRILRASDSPATALLLRIHPEQTASALQHIDTVWARHNPELPVMRQVYAQQFDQMVFESTNGVNQSAMFAALITMFIAVFGLYALALNASQRRTKEVGVRKALGASTGSIVGLLTWDFMKPVLVACLIAWIAGYYVISAFFAQFASYPDVPLLVYVAVASLTLVIAMATVALRCWRTANLDPVESLRYE